jgi:putative peptidoglycan lipid II flippase
MVINAGLAIGLAPVVGWLSPAIAATAAGWAMFAMLALGARRYGDAAKFDARFRKRIWRIIAASLIMGVTLWFFDLQLGAMLALSGWRGLGLLILIVIGAVAYFGSGQLVGAFRLSEFRSALRRSPKS